MSLLDDALFTVTQIIFEQKVRELAYAIWEKEGRPEGKALEHWLKAKKMVFVFLSL